MPTSVIVTSSRDIPHEVLANLVKTVIAVGLADAEATVEDANNFDEDTVAAAKDALDLNLTVSDLPAAALVVSDAGTPKVFATDGIEVATYDRSAPAPVPVMFQSMAALAGVPVVGQKVSCGKCATCSCATKA